MGQGPVAPCRESTWLPLPPEALAAETVKAGEPRLEPGLPKPPLHRRQRHRRRITSPPVADHVSSPSMTAITNRWADDASHFPGNVGSALAHGVGDQKALSLGLQVW